MTHSTNSRPVNRMKQENGTEGGVRDGDSKGESPNLPPMVAGRRVRQQGWIAKSGLDKNQNKLYDEYMIKILVKLPKSYEPAFFLKSSMLKEALCNVSYALTLSLKWWQWRFYSMYKMVKLHYITDYQLMPALIVISKQNMVFSGPFFEQAKVCLDQGQWIHA